MPPANSAVERQVPVARAAIPASTILTWSPEQYTDRAFVDDALAEYADDRSIKVAHAFMDYLINMAKRAKAAPRHTCEVRPKPKFMTSARYRLMEQIAPHGKASTPGSALQLAELHLAYVTGAEHVSFFHHTDMVEGFTFCSNTMTVKAA